MYATNGGFCHFVMFYKRKKEHAGSLVMLVVNSFILNIYWPPVRLTSNFYIFLLSTKTSRKNKCGFKLIKSVFLWYEIQVESDSWITESCSQQQRHSILHCSRPVYLGYKVLIKIMCMTLLYYFRFLLCCPCLQFHFIVWRSAELNVFGVEEMALANMQIKTLEVKKSIFKRR